MMDYTEKSFAAAGEASKLLITLSTALVAFCAALVNIKAAEPTLFTPETFYQKLLLAASWAPLLFSTAFGVWTQLAITDVLSQGAATPQSIWLRKITVPFILQIVAFLLGVGLLTLYGIIRLFA